MNISFSAPTIIVAITIVSSLIAIGMWIGSVNSDRSYFRVLGRELRADIKEILIRIPAPVATKGSPIELTALGKQVSVEIQAVDWARKAARVLLNTDLRDKQPYEIQQLSFSYMEGEFLSSEIMSDRINSSAFKNGISREDVLKVLAIELRDELFRVLNLQIP